MKWIRTIILAVMVLVALFLVVSIVLVSWPASTGTNRVAIEEPTETPDERIDYWSEVLAQRLFGQDEGICRIVDQPDGTFAIAADESTVNQIPREIAASVGIRAVEKLRSKCAQRGAQEPAPLN